MHWMWSTNMQLNLTNKCLNPRFLMLWYWEKEKKINKTFEKQLYESVGIAIMNI